jgi:hypothetical protein
MATWRSIREAGRDSGEAHQIVEREAGWDWRGRVTRYVSKEDTIRQSNIYCLVIRIGVRNVLRESRRQEGQEGSRFSWKRRAEARRAPR